MGKLKNWKTEFSQECSTPDISQNISVFQFFHWHFLESFRLSVSGNCCPELVSQLLAACVAIWIQHFLSLSFVRSQCIMGLRCKRHRAFRKCLASWREQAWCCAAIVRSRSDEPKLRTSPGHQSFPALSLSDPTQAKVWRWLLGATCLHSGSRLFLLLRCNCLVVTSLLLPWHPVSLPCPGLPGPFRLAFRTMS